MRHAMFEGLDGSGREDSIGRDSSGASYTERGDEPPRGAAWFDCLKKGADGRSNLPQPGARLPV